MKLRKKMRGWFTRISIKRLLMTINVIFLLNIAVFTVAGFSGSVVLVRQIVSSTAQTFDSTEKYIQDYMYNYKLIAARLAKQPEILNFLTVEDRFEQYLYANKIREEIHSLQVIRNEVSGIGVLKKDSDTMLVTEGYLWKLMNTGTFDGNPTGFSDLCTHYNNDRTQEYRQYFTLPVYGDDIGKNGEILGNVVISINTAIYTNLMGLAEVPDQDLFFIVDKQNNIAQTNSGEYSQTLSYSPMLSWFFKEPVCEYGGEQYLVFEKTVDINGWKMVYFSSLRSVFEQSFLTLALPLLIVILTEAVIFLICMLISRRVSGTLRSISAFTNDIFQQDYHKRLTIDTNDELQEIVSCVNTLLDKSQDMSRSILITQQQLYEAELTAKNMEMKFLQSQINPHFLYNTLSCIKSISELRDVPEISKLTTALSSFYRYGVKKDIGVTLREELGFVRDYFDIIGVRYMNRFTLEISAPEALLTAKVFRMLIQPFVENCLLHGLEKKRGSGTVKIDVSLDGEDLLIDISDNGKGVSEERLKHLQKYFGGKEALSNSVGLINVQSRIQNLYGEAYGFAVSSPQSGGFTVRIRIPYQI